MIRLAGMMGAAALVGALVPMADPRRPRVARMARRVLLALGLLAVAGTALYASGLPRDALWGVEQSCLLDHRLFGLPLPCLEVAPDRGVVVLRAPLASTHIVVMPIAAIEGIEAPVLRRPDTPAYLQQAWAARRFVETGVGHPLDWTDVGLAINSRWTRSQDQLHIHVDCVRQALKRSLATVGASLPTDRWQEAGLTVWRFPLWARRIDAPTLEGVDVFGLVDQIPGYAARPADTLLAVVGIDEPDGRHGFALLAGQSEPRFGADQFTSEHLLDHRCS